MTPHLSAYIDETGDRGSTGSASPIFGMAAAIVDPQGEIAARAALAKLRQDFGTPASRPLSWKDDLGKHERRKHAARALAKLTDIRIVYVCNDKSATRPGTYTSDTNTFYNYVAYYTLERVLRVADAWPGGPFDVAVRFGAVRKFDHKLTDSYFKRKRSYPYDPYPPPWRRLASCTWVQASQYDMSQVADVYAGFMKAAVWPDQFGNTEGSYLREVWHQINCTNTCAKGKGLKGMPSHDIFDRQDWWPCTC